jgi:hypothetical protein
MYRIVLLMNRHHMAMTMLIWIIFIVSSVSLISSFQWYDTTMTKYTIFRIQEYGDNNFRSRRPSLSSSLTSIQNNHCRSQHRYTSRSTSVAIPSTINNINYMNSLRSVTSTCLASSNTNELVRFFLYIRNNISPLPFFFSLISHIFPMSFFRCH